MSHQDAAALVKFQLQKCVIAAAITVLKCKPANKTTTDYCNIIKQNILKGNETPPIDIEDGFIDDTFCNIFSRQDVNNCSLSKATPLFSDFVSASCSEPFSKESDVLNFGVLKAISNIKHTIYQLNGTFSSSENIYLDHELEKNQNKSTQESGYDSEQHKSTFFKIGKNIDYTLLNKSLLLLLDFLMKTPQKDQGNSMAKYISELIGKLTDVLYQNNINISSFEKVLETSDIILNKLFSNTISQNLKNSSQPTYICKFFLLNESYLMVRYSIKMVMKRIESLLSKISDRNCDKEIELSDPDFTDNSYLLFFLTERLLKKYSACKMQFKTSEKVFNETENLTGEYSLLFSMDKRLRQRSEYSNGQFFFETDNLDEIFTDVLNRAALECVETYPLIAFWAIDCLNSLTKTCF